MANEKVKLKGGMAGSSAGRGRAATNGALKRSSKVVQKARRREGRARVAEEG